MNYFEPLNTNGWVKCQNFIAENVLNELRDAVDNAYLLCREIQIKNGLAANTDGTAHHLPAVRNSIFIELLDNFTTHEIENLLSSYFQGKYILNSYGGILNKVNTHSYVKNIHRDIRFFTQDANFMINVLIMLDDFTYDNGATYLLSKSHTADEKPNESIFYKNAERAIGSAGDAIFFNSKLWHAAGDNNSNKARRAITITLSKPFFKQQLDYCKVIGESNVDRLKDEIKQLVGYKSRIPSSLEEWYQPKELRYYQPDQDIQSV